MNSNQLIIMQKALSLFSAFGYEATGTQQICDAAGVTKPTLYHYFKSKRGLIDSILSENFTPFLTHVEEACAYQHDLTLNLEAVTRAYFQFAQQEPVFYRLQLALRSAPLQSESYEAIAPWAEKESVVLQQLFVAAECDHGNMRGRSQAYALTLLGMINAYIHHAADQGEPLTDTLIHQARHQFMHGIFS